MPQAVRSGTLTPSTVATVSNAQDVTEFAVTHHGNVTAPLYVRGDGVNPTVKGNDCYPVLPGQTKWLGRTRTAATDDGTAIKIISASAADYSVEFP